MTGTAFVSRKKRGLIDQEPVLKVSDKIIPFKDYISKVQEGSEEEEEAIETQALEVTKSLFDFQIFMFYNIF